MSIAEREIKSLIGELMDENNRMISRIADIQLSDRFSELTSLPRGWDGYSGLPVSFDRAQFAANLIERICIEGIPAPQLVPGSDGTIQIEWHVNQFDIEIDVLAPYNVTATRFDYISEEEEEIELQADFTALAKWVSELGQSRTCSPRVWGLTERNLL